MPFPERGVLPFLVVGPSSGPSFTLVTWSAAVQRLGESMKPSIGYFQFGGLLWMLVRVTSFDTRERGVCRELESGRTATSHKSMLASP